MRKLTRPGRLVLTATFLCIAPGGATAEDGAPLPPGVVLDLAEDAALLPDGSILAWMQAITFNVAGANPGDIYGDFDPIADIITDFIVDETPDLVALQEVPFNHPQHDHDDGVTMIAQMLQQKGYPMNYRAMPYWAGLPNIRLMVLSKQPILEYEAIIKPGSDCQNGTGNPTMHTQTFVVDNLATGGYKKYRVFNYHACVYRPNWAVNAFLQVVDDYYDDGEMIIPLGDFNLQWGSPAHQAGFDKMMVEFRNSCVEQGDQSCFHSVNLEYHPDGVVDYIWVRKGTFFPYDAPWTSYWVRNNAAINDPVDVSDHIPIIGTFSFTLPN